MPTDPVQVVDWREAGCKPSPRVKGTTSTPGGRAAWRLRAPRRARADWSIEAHHCPYLGRPPYTYGDDAWRISIQVPRYDGRFVEVAHLVATSEADAFASVVWLDAVARPEEVSR